MPKQKTRWFVALILAGGLMFVGPSVIKQASYTACMCQACPGENYTDCIDNPVAKCRSYTQEIPDPTMWLTDAIRNSSEKLATGISVKGQ
jgi:hypothetical protein